MKNIKLSKILVVVVIAWVWMCITALIQQYLNPEMSAQDLFRNIPNQVILKFLK